MSFAAVAFYRCEGRAHRAARATIKAIQRRKLAGRGERLILPPLVVHISDVSPNEFAIHAHCHLIAKTGRACVAFALCGRCFDWQIELGERLHWGRAMKNSFLGIVALFVISVSVTARGADMPVKAPPAEPPYNWSGLYFGANFGGAWTSGSLTIPGNNLYGGITEFIAGVQLGYNVQAGHLLLGIEGDFDWASFGHPALPTPTLGSVSQNWIGTVAGRVGLVEDRWLLYAKLGGGWVHRNATLNLSGVNWQGSNTRSGSLFGAGVEYGLQSQWTIKLEYDQIV